MSAIVNTRPPCSGTRLSTRSTSASSSTSRRARLEPMKPSPPVMRTRQFLKWRSAAIPALPAREKKAAEFGLLGCSVNRGAVAHQDLTDETQAQAGGMTQELLPVKNPAHVFSGIPMPVGSLDHGERCDPMDNREAGDVDVAAAGPRESNSFIILDFLIIQRTANLIQI